jgi:hypothetical protein
MFHSSVVSDSYHIGKSLNRDQQKSLVVTTQVTHQCCMNTTFCTHIRLPIPLPSPILGRGIYTIRNIPENSGMIYIKNQSEISVNSL